MLPYCVRMDVIDKVIAMRDQKQAGILLHFLSNLYILFDGSLPSHIEQYITELAEKLDEENHIHTAA